MKTQLDKSLDKMPMRFSSNMFSNECRANGISERDIRDGICANYLKNNCNRGDGKRTWYKKNNQISKEITINRAIELLKSEGYKIYKQTFTEI